MIYTEYCCTGESASQEERLGFLVMEGLTHLLSSNSQNAAVFRESGGAKCVIALVPHLQCRSQALGEPFLYIVLI